MYSADGGGPPSQPAITYAPSAKPGAASSSTQRSSGGGTTNRAGSVQRRSAKKKQTSIKDSSGTALITNDASGFGLKRPYIPWTVYPTIEETVPTKTTTSGTFVSLWTVATEPQHPKVRVRVLAVTGAATSGEVRLVDRATGTVIAGPQVIGLATSLEFTLDATLIAPTLSGAGAPMKVDVQARTTAGASTIGVLVVYVLGIGT
jgi:hypothetical protein